MTIDNFINRVNTKSEKFINKVQGESSMKNLINTLTNTVKISKEIRNYVKYFVEFTIEGVEYGKSKENGLNVYLTIPEDSPLLDGGNDLLPIFFDKAVEVNFELPKPKEEESKTSVVQSIKEKLLRDSNEAKGDIIGELSNTNKSPTYYNVYLTMPTGVVIGSGKDHNVQIGLSGYPGTNFNDELEALQLIIKQADTYKLVKYEEAPKATQESLQELLASL